MSRIRAPGPARVGLVANRDRVARTDRVLDRQQAAEPARVLPRVAVVRQAWRAELSKHEYVESSLFPLCVPLYQNERHLHAVGTLNLAPRRQGLLWRE
jgi:hypothetical protein